MSRCARPHVPEEEFHAWLDGALSKVQSAEIAEHLLGCLICRAAYSEAVATRDRATAILAFAAPLGHRRALPMVQHTSRRRQSGIAAAVGVLMLGGWLANQPATLALPTPRLSTMAFVAPAMHASFLENAALQGTANRSRSERLAVEATLRPQMVRPAAAGRGMVALAPVADVDPAISWEAISWDEALTAAGGSLARLDGLPVTGVRLQRNGVGIRPTFFVKQRLPDGRAVWVIEGPEDRVEPVHAAVEASGLSSSVALRTKPDYVTSGESTIRTLRLVTISAALPKDSVDALTAKLRLE
ncbi:MAG: hypothetical protein IPG05_03835 [Gemmatimonadetes bacterium]|nr:hypothetical protein [Gemmatimonadota bacterium]